MEDSRDFILYIDDEQENLTGFKYAFKKSYNVLIASSADEGWEILRNHKVKVILTDQRMPRTTGVQFLEKAALEYPQVGRILLTGYTDVQDIIQAINLGKIFQFIRKPWDKEEVKIIIDNAIRVYDLQEQNQKLLVSIQKSNLQLEEINKTLEKKVLERTNELQVKNSELEIHQNHLEDIVKKRTAELIIAKDRAEESDRLKTAFLANVSHEIRTPMNAIIGFSELMVSDTYTLEELSEFKEQIVINSHALLRLIDDILDISSIEANQLNMNLKNHDLHRELKELEVFYSEQKKVVGKSELEIIYDKPSTKEFLIHTDKVRLNQILINLIGNAFKFTEQGFIRFGYDLVPDTKFKYILRFYVKDNGIGIPKESQTIIFERFRKVEFSTDKIFRGTGLGLFISKSLVELFGGKIWFESEVGKGSVFYFEIPYIPADSKGVEPEIFGNDTFYERFNFDGKSILVAEDEDSSYLYIERVLRKTRVKLIRAKNGQETLDILHRNQLPDLILMDIQMPVLNGYEAISLIRQKHFDVPIIVQTAYALTNQKDKIMKSGCNDFIPKPYKSDELLDMISRYI